MDLTTAIVVIMVALLVCVTVLLAVSMVLAYLRAANGVVMPGERAERAERTRAGE